MNIGGLFPDRDSEDWSEIPPERQHVLAVIGHRDDKRMIGYVQQLEAQRPFTARSPVEHFLVLTQRLP